MIASTRSERAAEIERYRQAQAIFDEVVDLDPVSRAAAVAVACGPDDALRALITELIELDEQDSPVDNASESLARDLARSMGAVDRLKPGDVVDRYVVEHLLGTGGTAQVWAVRHQSLGTRHALKVLTLPDDTLRRRLMREARAQASLEHPNIVPVRDVLTIDDTPALLMPLIDGPPLDILLRHVTPAPEEANWLIHGIVMGVGHAHKNGLIHRDIKAANVLLDLRDGQLVPRVADFGLVKAMDAQTLTRPGDIMCTLASAAPEQLVDPSHVDVRADIWSLGVVAFHIATGRSPFPGETLQAIVEAHLEGPDLDAVPEPLRPMVAAALVADRNHRAASAEALLALLPPVPSPAPTERLALLSARLRDGIATGELFARPHTTLNPARPARTPTLQPSATPSPSDTPQSTARSLRPVPVLLAVVVASAVAATAAYFWGP